MTTRDTGEIPDRVACPNCCEVAMGLAARREAFGLVVYIKGSCGLCGARIDIAGHDEHDMAKAQQHAIAMLRNEWARLRAAFSNTPGATPKERVDNHKQAVASDGRWLKKKPRKR